MADIDPCPPGECVMPYPRCIRGKGGPSPDCGICARHLGAYDDTLPGHAGYTPASFEEALHFVIEEAFEVMIHKRRLRGTTNIEEQGLRGVVERIRADKLSRIARTVDDLDLVARLKARGIDPASVGVHEPTLDASFEDDLIDVANYAIICVLLRRGWWSLPDRT